MTEEETLWIQQALQGNDTSFGYLVEKYQKPVFSLCCRLLGNAKDAEDAAQESFLRAYLHLKRFDLTRSFSTWLLSIAAHYCIDRMRKRQLLTVSTDSLPAEIIADRYAPNPERLYRERAREAMIERLLNQLQPADRAAIVLRY